MELTVDDIRERVREIEDSRAEYKRRAEYWQDMWGMKVFSRSRDEALQDGQEQVTLPTGYNVVQLASRIIGSNARIQVPAETAEDDDDQAASKRQRWLQAIWQRNSRETRRNVIDDAKWWALVRGRFVLEVKWVEEVLPKRLQGSKLPIRIRTLDPLKCGFHAGPLYTDFAYSKDSQTRRFARQMFPKLKLEQARPTRFNGNEEDEKIDIIDAWWIDEETGDVWNAVVVEDEFAKKPAKTAYPDLPLLEGFGDSAPLSEEEYRALSILHPIHELYPYQCRLVSQIGTGLLWFFWPALTVTNEMGQQVPDLNLQPGTTTVLPPGTRVDSVRGDVNVPLANAMLMQVEGSMQESTFPSVMYGKQPGELSAGYGVSILADAARGRVVQFTENLETGMEHANEIMLGLVEAFAKEKGVQVWGKNAVGDIYHEVLQPADIQGAYHNMVTLHPEVATDDVQKQTLGLRMVEMGISSKRTFREQVSRMEWPDDEARRVAIEQALESDEFKPKTNLRAIQSYYPDEWEETVAGTSLEQLAQQEDQRRKAQEDQRQQMMQQGPGGQGGPAGMMPPGMPPEMMAGGPAGMGPGGPDMGMQAPGLMGATGVPPEMQGQLTPELLGLPPGTPPGVYQDLTGQAPLSPEEQMRQAMGLPPEMMA